MANETVQVKINGQWKDLPRHCTVVEMLTALNLNPSARGIAVAINDEVIPRGRHREVHLQSNDLVEIIHPVGGG